MLNRRNLFLIGVPLLSAGCGMQTTYEDVSEQKQYKSLVGQEYRVVASLDAYGVRRHSKGDVEQVVLQPPPGFTGPEVGFKRPIPLGTVLKITRVLMTNRWFDPPLTLEVVLLNFDLASGARVLIDLMQGNELAKTNSLNPSVYQKI